MKQDKLRNPDERAIQAQDKLSRREEVVQAAMEVLAIRGARGFTHREVDRHLGRPLGSTSNYYRRRNDLLSAVGAYVMDLDMQDTTRRIATLKSSSHVTIEDTAEQLEQLFQHWARPENRNRAVARLEIMVESIRDADVNRATHDQVKLAEDRFQWVFEQLGSRNPKLSSTTFFRLLASMNLLILWDDPASGAMISRTLLRDWLAASLNISAESID